MNSFENIAGDMVDKAQIAAAVFQELNQKETNKSAYISFAVESIISSITFDNGTVCASEQSVVVEKKIAARVKSEFEKKTFKIADLDRMLHVT